MKNLATAGSVTLVTKEDFKRSVHIFMDETHDDELIDQLIKSATAVVDTATGQPIAVADYEFVLPSGVYSTWWFPVRAVSAISTLLTQDDLGVWVAVDLAGTILVDGHDEPRAVFSDAVQSLLASGAPIKLIASCGGAADEQQRQAIILLVKEWRDAGISDDQVVKPGLSFGIERLIKQVRYRRPQVVA